MSLAARHTAILAVVLALTAPLAASPSGAVPPSGASEGPLDVLRGGQRPGFALALAPRPFSFPLDHGPHPQFAHEWWYVTGHLRGPRAERFGFELAFFRLGLAPPGSPLATAATTGSTPSGASRWRAHEIYVAHFAITDLPAGRFVARARYARAALGLAGAQADPLRVWLDGWSLGAAPSGEWQLHAAEGDYELTLQLRPLMSPVLNGIAGLSVKSGEPGAASYYYSVPRIAVQGRLRADSRELPVQGLAWLDREWGSGALGTNEQGWDWFAVQLDDGSTLMYYALRDRDGTLDSHSAGTFVAADGRIQGLAAQDLRIEVLDYWTSPRGGRYPARWRLRSSALGLDLSVQPLLADQELDTSPRYWEGAVQVSGSRAGRRASGQGYVELVGYAR